jgi:UDP-N-acetylmuramoylalanine--D-glutamate ligase
MGFDTFLSDAGMLKYEYKTQLISKNIDFEEGVHTESKILNADEIIKSPGIPDTAPLIVKALAKGINVISEIEFAARYTDAFLIGITGTNGKTTTTMLTYHILKNAGLNVGLAGNVGKSFALQVAENDFTHYVLEISSFQLDGCYKVRFNIGMILNITPDHLNRYDYKLENYARSKLRIAQNQQAEDFFIYCKDDAITQQFISELPGLAQKQTFTLQNDNSAQGYIEENKLVININNNRFDMFLNELALQGKHNAYNSMAAGISARNIDIKKEALRESLSDFKNVEHRLEFVLKIKDVEYINDSKATNSNAAFYALESMTKPVIWIAGGQDKGEDISVLRDIVKQKVKTIICIGKDNSKIIESFGDLIENITECETMEQAVEVAYYIGKKGDVVLLSPAYASFDKFENYQDRGNKFKEAIKKL